MMNYHRIRFTKSQGLEETFGDHLVQPPAKVGSLEQEEYTEYTGKKVLIVFDSEIGNVNSCIGSKRA